MKGRSSAGVVRLPDPDADRIDSIESPCGMRSRYRQQSKFMRKNMPTKPSAVQMSCRMMK